jgi:hypothetical protein
VMLITIVHIMRGPGMDACSAESKYESTSRPEVAEWG